MSATIFSISILEEFGKVFTKCHNGDQGGGGRPRSPCLPVSFTRSSSVTALWGRARDDVSVRLQARTRRHVTLP